MKQGSGELIFKAVPLMIVAGAAVLFFIIDRFLRKDDGPDYRDS